MTIHQAFEQIAKSGSILRPDDFALQLIALSLNKDNRPQFLSAIQDNRDFVTQVVTYAESSFTKPAPEIESIEKIVDAVGMAAISNLALILSLLDLNRYGKCFQFDYQRFWQKSIVQGTAARALAIKHNLDEEKFFTYAILSQIGELGFACVYPSEYAKLLADGLSPAERILLEKQTFGLSSFELSWKLLASWKLPEQCTDLIKEYGNQKNKSKESPHQDSTFCQILNFADLIAQIALLDPPLAPTFIQAEKLAEDFSISGKQFGRFFDQLIGHWQTASEYFELPPLKCPGYLQIKMSDTSNFQPIENELSPITILAADDDPLTLMSLEKIVGAKHRVLLKAENGNQALQIALEQRPDVLLTDWRMPLIDGIDLCKILRKTKVTQHIYIIMLTGNETEGNLVCAFDAGADDYVVKPFTPNVLLARLCSGERLVRHQQTINEDRKVIEKYAKRLATANKKLQNIAMTDFLTGLPNRRSALIRLKNLLAEARRFGEALSCLMIDIDHFKNINDTYGHDCGDKVLVLLSKLFEDKARSYDMVSRWGGEEFLVISARSNANDAYQLAERFRSSVEKLEFVPTKEIAIQITISVGIATWTKDCIDENTLLKEADTYLYLAKSKGRNRVESSKNMVH